jgi:hypothetical protein
MSPEREFLREQATACRQLALISTAEDARKLRVLASEYDELATKGIACANANDEPTRQRPN